MNIFNRLVRGELSLTVTFWVFGVFVFFVLQLSTFIIFCLSKNSVYGAGLIFLVFLARCILMLMTSIGLWKMILNKNSVLALLAFLLMGLVFIYTCSDIIAAARVFLRILSRIS
ncbi:hypothetical protein [Gilliamella intestini]|uniref:Uncharacterized protein n=1 Tax=Gilliamella intestini TaxID=1798183 RepID=A0A1C4DN98_9GAMM|nr:hypothetical protein [Gilliamella intestini]SCC32745.1 hypothetical protein GA0061080_10876 [Gilliamella intestini]